MNGLKNENGGLSPRSLTSEEALSILISDLEAANQRFYTEHKRTFLKVIRLVLFHNAFSFWPNILVLSLVTILAAVVYLVSSDWWYFLEAICLAIVVFLNTFFVVTDSIFTHDELAAKIRRLIGHLRQVDKSKLDDCDLRNVEFFPSTSICRIVRNDKIHVLPSSLVVRGDIIALAPGEKMVFSGQLLPDYELPPDTPGKERGADPFGVGVKASDLLGTRTVIVPYPSLVFYQLSETPLVAKIEEKLCSERQHLPPPILKLVLAVRRWHFFVIVPIVTVFCIIFVILMSYLHGYTTLTSIICDLFPFIIHSVSAICVPLLPTMLMLLRCLGNALIVEESHRLLSTRNERANSGADEAFEYVEIIRPTKLFTPSKIVVFRNILLGRQPDSLPRTGNILFGFANLNYLCAIDKEGILSCPRPVLQKLLIFSSAQSQSGSHMPRNSSFGTFMSSDTVASGQGRHVRMETLHAITRNQEGGLNSLDFDEKQWFRHMGVLKPLGLNMVVTSSQLYTDKCRSFVNYLNRLVFTQ